METGSFVMMRGAHPASKLHRTRAVRPIAGLSCAAVIDSELQRVGFATFETRGSRADLKEGLDQARTAEIGVPHDGPSLFRGHGNFDRIDFDEVRLGNQ